MTSVTQLKQRADYTYKHNHTAGRHGWLRLTPAYSVKVVDEILNDISKENYNVLDPFCGTGTTALCVINHGHPAATVEVNPFLVWLAKTKTANYTPTIIQATRHACADAIALTNSKKFNSILPEPPIFNIERWWSLGARSFLCRLRSAIETVTAENTPQRSLLLVAFCRSLITLSNAAFNHQSMSFRDKAAELPLNLSDQFQMDVAHVLHGAILQLNNEAQIIHGDARTLETLDQKFDFVITSPPYANRMSYIRELRPYMYWLGYLVNSRDAGELDWKPIGGTWGIATSRLAEWIQSIDIYKPAWLAKTLDCIAHSDNANGILLANYIAKYSEDMWLHFAGLTHCLNPKAEVHYIVGNSIFYGNMMPTEKLYADMLSQLGFTEVKIKPIRKRNSKKDLIEFDVTGIRK